MKTSNSLKFIDFSINQTPSIIQIFEVVLSKSIIHMRGYKFPVSFFAEMHTGHPINQIIKNSYSIYIQEK
jgi:hypothetical protein